jgi:hypothetical protein
VRFVVDEVALGQFSPLLLRLSSLTTIPHCSVLISICILLLPEGKRAKNGTLSKKQCSFGNRATLEGKVFSVLVIFKGVV